MENKALAKKILNIVGNVLLYLFIGICIFGVVLTITSKKDADGTATIFGRQMRVVVSASMEKCDATDVSGFEIKDIPLGSMVFIEVVPEDEAEAKKWYSELKVGDVLTFKYVYTRQETITHRITNIVENENGGYTITLLGDNRDDEMGGIAQTIDTSKTDSPDYVIGKVTGQSKALGFFISTLKSPVGIVFIVIIPALIIMILEIFKIDKIVNSDKKKNEEEEKEEQLSEIERLRRELAELKAQENQGEDPEKKETVKQDSTGEEPTK